MKMDAKKKIYFLLYLFLSMFAAFCLLAYIDEITLVTAMQKIFVWTYLSLMLLVIQYVMRKKILCFIKEYKLWTLLMLAIVLIWSIVTRDKFLPQQFVENTVEIVILNDKNADSQGQEVWLNSISLDGDIQSLETYVNPENGWNFTQNALNGSYQNSNALELKLPAAKKIKFKFSMHAWSGMLEIKNKEQIQTCDLYAPVSDEYVLILDGQSVPYQGIYQYILLLGYFSVCIILVEIFACLFRKVKK